MAKRRGSKSRQGVLAFPQWGGARRGAGRKRAAHRPSVAHRARGPAAARFPLHITLRIAPGLPSLRGARTHAVLLRVLEAASDRNRFRVVQYSAQSNHLHLVCEASGRESITRGLQGLCVRLARALNRSWNRHGTVFGDRYHVRVLRTPREVRNALAYVLRNARRHGIRHAQGMDPCSSAAAFEGWRGRGAPGPARSPLAEARTWLLRVGWRRWGLLPWED